MSDAPSRMRQSGWRLMLKTAVDRCVAGYALAVAAPVILGSMAAIRVTMGAPVLFRQQRPGRHGKPFVVFKLRTMQEAHDTDGRLLPDVRRLTKLGRFLRANSIDELPQLWNVLRGDLSLVGPRPLLMQYIGRYTPDQARRHDVLPGITGWAQINGRNALTWEQKFALDLWYVDNWSLRLDLSILLSTVRKVLSREGVSNEGHATMPEFRGEQRGG